MEVKEVPGKRAPKDKLIMIQTHGWETLSLETIGEMLLPFMRNEEYLHPREEGNEGYRKPLAFLRDAYERGLDYALAKHLARQMGLDWLDKAIERSQQ